MLNNNVLYGKVNVKGPINVLNDNNDGNKLDLMLYNYKPVINITKCNNYVVPEVVEPIEEPVEKKNNILENVVTQIIQPFIDVKEGIVEKDLKKLTKGVVKLAAPAIVAGGHYYITNKVVKDVGVNLGKVVTFKELNKLPCGNVCQTIGYTVVDFVAPTHGCEIGYKPIDLLCCPKDVTKAIHHEVVDSLVCRYRA